MADGSCTHRLSIDFGELNVFISEETRKVPGCMLLWGNDVVVKGDAPSIRGDYGIVSVEIEDKPNKVRALGIAMERLGYKLIERGFWRRF